MIYVMWRGPLLEALMINCAAPRVKGHVRRVGVTWLDVDLMRAGSGSSRPQWSSSSGAAVELPSYTATWS